MILGPLIAVGLAFLLAGIPVALAALAGRITPLYRLETAVYFRWWGWFAFLKLHQGGLQEALWQELGATIANRETEVQ